LLAFCDAPRGDPLDDVAAAFDRVLAEPLDFPPLSQAAVPGDKVAIVLDHDIPQLGSVVARTVAVLLARGVAIEDITLLRTLADAELGQRDPLEMLPQEIRPGIGNLIHDPSHRDALRYLGATDDARPIYINRAIHEADLVIPVGCLRLAGSPGYHGTSSSIFPAFSDVTSIDRYRSPNTSQLTHQRRLGKQADHVRWLLGVQFTIQVVPGAGDNILHVLAGEVSSVLREGSRLCEQAWRYDIPGRAEVVVTTIEGDATEQTWQNVGRALAAASHAVREEGAVVLCTDLAASPEPAIARILGADDVSDALRDIDKARSADALAAEELVRALQRGKVFFVSRLDDDQVEDLGMSPIASEQISRLAARYDSCIVLCNAHRALARANASQADEAPIARRRLRR
jgi:nickel-dependent lactate racemase